MLREDAALRPLSQLDLPAEKRMAWREISIFTAIYIPIPTCIGLVGAWRAILKSGGFNGKNSAVNFKRVFHWVDSFA